jgi:hypothetical protein
MKISVMGALVIVLLAFAGCWFDSGTQVAGGAEDFPNTITALGKVAAADISSHTQWDQFQGIPQPPDVQSMADTLLTPVLSKVAASSLSVLVLDKSANQDPLDDDDNAHYTVDKHNRDGDSLITHIQVCGGPDGKVNTKADNRFVEYDDLRIRNGDTLEWTWLHDADGDGTLWGDGDSGVVEMLYINKSPFLMPQVASRALTLKARIYHRGDSSVLLSYQEHDSLNNGTLIVFKAKGIRGDSALIPGDTALVTYDQTPSLAARLMTSKSRYMVRLSAQPWQFSGNALLRYTIENRWRSGVIRHSVFDFTPGAPVVSGHLDIRGDFNDTTEDQTGAIGYLQGGLNGDTIQVDMRELRDGKNKNYRMVYDSQGEIRRQEHRPD